MSASILVVLSTYISSLLPRDLSSCNIKSSVPVSMGGEVQSSGRVWSHRDADFPGDIDCRISLDMEEGRARMGVNPSNLNASVTDEVFTASRFTKGNLFFPTRIVVSPLRVSRVKRRLFGSLEENISISQVASVKISTGVFWSDILIESTGGTDPITSHGHRKADAIRIRDLVESFQAGRR